MNQPIECRCGTFKGYVVDATRANRCVCYCMDCQTFAYFLGRQSEILDRQAGTEVVQTTPANVIFTQGLKSVACMRLASLKMSFVGLVHTCLKGSGTNLEDFGPIRMRVNTQSAKGTIRTSAISTVSGMLRAIGMLTRARLDGSYKDTPFFVSGTGAPIVAPIVLERSERERLRDRLRNAL